MIFVSADTDCIGTDGCKRIVGLIGQCHYQRPSFLLKAPFPFARQSQAKEITPGLQDQGMILCFKTLAWIRSLNS